MIKNQSILAVSDVSKSSAWYQKLLGCNSKHGGNTFEMLSDNEDNIFLCLHKWGEHEHPTLSNSKIQAGNGLVLYIQVLDLDEVWHNAQSLNATIEEEPHLNPNSGKQQFCVRDLDNYYLMITL